MAAQKPRRISQGKGEMGLVMATEHSQVAAAPKKDENRFETLDYSPEWDLQLMDARVDVLLKLAGFAKAIAQNYLSNDNFKRLLKFANEERVATADEVAGMGNVERTTASRWINGHTAPNLLVQKEVLLKISEKAASMATTMKELPASRN